MPSLHFKGVAHPPARKDGKRDHNADLNSAEISTTNLGRRGGTDLLYEHDHGDRVGHVTSSWRGPRGELRVSGIVHDEKMIERVKSGHSRGLSLGSSVISDTAGTRVMAMQDELSLCVEPRRGGCYVDEIDGKRVLRSHRASAGMPPPTTTPTTCAIHTSPSSTAKDDNRNSAPAYQNTS